MTTPGGGARVGAPTVVLSDSLINRWIAGNLTIAEGIIDKLFWGGYFDVRANSYSNPLFA
jgi:hypothetical protein